MTNQKLYFLFIVLILGQMALAQNPRNVVMYDITSTDCGPCSCLDSLAKTDILPTYPRTIILAIHSPFNSAFKDYVGNEIYFNFNAPYSPSANIDGLGYYAQWEHTMDSLGKRYTDSPDAPVSINISNKNWDASSRECSFSASFTNLNNTMQGNFRCQVFISEDDIIMTHRTFQGCSRPNNPFGLPFKHDYVNNHVVRMVVCLPDSSSANPLWGDSLVSSEWAQGVTITKSWTVPIDTAWAETNCYLNIIAYKDNADILYKSIHLQGIKEAITSGSGINDNMSLYSSSKIVNIYPNPASGITHIHLNQKSKGYCKLEIYDMQGAYVETIIDQQLNSGITNVEYSTAHLKPGIYMCTSHHPDGISSEKLVVK